MVKKVDTRIEQLLRYDQILRIVLMRLLLTLPLPKLKEIDTSMSKYLCRSREWKIKRNGSSN